MKGLRPLHASQELKRDFLDNMRPDWRETSQGTEIVLDFSPDELPVCVVK